MPRRVFASGLVTGTGQLPGRLRSLLSIKAVAVRYHIYADESRQCKDRFMVLGGLIAEASDVPRFEATMAEFRQETKMFGELKWSKVTDKKSKEYQLFVEYFFTLLDADTLRFHCVVLDNHQINHRKFNQGDKELGFYKFYYQLLLHCFGKKYCGHGEDDHFVLHLDHRTTHYKLGTLKKVLNNGMKKDFQIDSQPFRSIEPKNSKESELIQINDIVLGAIGFQKNDYDLRPNTRQSKKDLAALIAKKAGITNLKGDTPRKSNRFTIWNFVLRK
jgi:hypothetical protein